jgi:hypothetical protein
VDDGKDKNLMSVAVSEVKALHDMTLRVLLDWLETPPTERREEQALQLLGEANQILYAACINLDAFDSEGVGGSESGGRRTHG